MGMLICGVYIFFLNYLLIFFFVIYRAFLCQVSLTGAEHFTNIMYKVIEKSMF